MAQNKAGDPTTNSNAMGQTEANSKAHANAKSRVGSAAVDLTPPLAKRQRRQGSPQANAKSTSEATPKVTAEAVAKATAMAKPGAAGAASRMRSFVASQVESTQVSALQDASPQGVASCEGGNPMRRCRNSMAQLENHRRMGVVTPERYAAWKSSSHAYHR